MVNAAMGSGESRMPDKAWGPWSTLSSSESEEDSLLLFAGESGHIGVDGANGTNEVLGAVGTC